MTDSNSLKILKLKRLQCVREKSDANICTATNLYDNLKGQTQGLSKKYVAWRSIKVVLVALNFELWKKGC